MTKDRKNLFVQFTFLFVLSAGVILLALFFTRDPDGSDSGDSQQQQLYAEFKNFDKLKPQLLQLVDGINAQVNIIQAENGGNNTASYTANNLIDDFQRRYNPQQDTFALKVTDMLRLYLQAATETGGVITVEEHSVHGGLGEACASLLLQSGHHPRFKIVGFPDVHMVNGSQPEIFQHYGIDGPGLAAATKKLFSQ